MFSAPAVNTGHKYINCSSSEPDAHHFSMSDFEIDEQWHDLDLSGIVGKREVLALIYITIENSAAENEVLFDTKNPAIKYNNIGFWTHAANEKCPYFIPISTDENGCIKYKFYSFTWLAAYLSVIGYFVK